MITSQKTCANNNRNACAILQNYVRFSAKVRVFAHLVRLSRCLNGVTKKGFMLAGFLHSPLLLN